MSEPYRQAKEEELVSTQDRINWNTNSTKMGWVDYNDLNTSTNPISVIGGLDFVDITNDGEGAFTNVNYLPSNITSIYNENTNEFNWTQLKLGDTIDIRLDLEITTISTNTEIDIYLLMSIGQNPYPTPFVTEKNYKTVGTYNINVLNGIYMGDLNTFNGPAKFQIKSDKTCTIKVRGWYCKIIRY